MVEGTGGSSGYGALGFLLQCKVPRSDELPWTSGRGEDAQVVNPHPALWHLHSTLLCGEGDGNWYTLQGEVEAHLSDGFGWHRDTKKAFGTEAELTKPVPSFS